MLPVRTLFESCRFDAALPVIMLMLFMIIITMRMRVTPLPCRDMR